MTELKCSVSSCASNKDHLCVLHNIHVEGRTASSADETACGSYQTRLSAPTNALEGVSPASETEVRCAATDCRYNQGEHCRAGSIYVQGGGYHGSGTRCDTFKAKN